jgi:hypothetical protein
VGQEHHQDQGSGDVPGADRGAPQGPGQHGWQIDDSDDYKHVIKPTQKVETILARAEDFGSPAHDRPEIKIVPGDSMPSCRCNALQIRV